MTNHHRLVTGYLATAGLHGCLPNYSELCGSLEQAVLDLAALHELTQDQIFTLRQDRYVKLDLREQGNEYCEIVEVARRG